MPWKILLAMQGHLLCRKWSFLKFLPKNDWVVCERSQSVCHESTSLHRFDKHIYIRDFDNISSVYQADILGTFQRFGLGILKSMISCDNSSTLVLVHEGLQNGRKIRLTKSLCLLYASVIRQSSLRQQRSTIAPWRRETMSIRWSSDASDMLIKPFHVHGCPKQMCRTPISPATGLNYII